MSASGLDEDEAMVEVRRQTKSRMDAAVRGYEWMNQQREFDYKFGDLPSS